MYKARVGASKRVVAVKMLKGCLSIGVALVSYVYYDLLFSLQTL